MNVNVDFRVSNGGIRISIDFDFTMKIYAILLPKKKKAVVKELIRKNTTSIDLL
jgi:hypothetical protein